METLRDGSQVLIRPIRREDAELERRFIEGLSPESRRFRFLGCVATPSDEMVRRLTDIDPEREAALIAVARQDGHERQVGVARFCKTSDDRAEVAVTVADDWQRRGLGTLLLRRLINLARASGVRTLYSVDSSGNARMRELATHMGFSCQPDPADRTQVVYSLEVEAG
ncbi:MAG: GNAT family N-acetyltransferase [Pseudomonadota bacterium]|jgi:GNAT superfamily N-acetyltransferase|nr:MAG: GNAT family N-acetyltransferase [Pseudomonadota bacterium]